MNRSMLIVAAGILSGVVGCNTVTPPIEGRQDIYHASDPTQVFLDSTDLRSDTAFDTPQVSRDANGLLHVSVPIRSVINKQLYIEYRVIFFDSDHQEIDRSPWRDKTLAANVPDRVNVNTTNPRAQTFQVHFRYPTGTEMN